MSAVKRAAQGVLTGVACIGILAGILVPSSPAIASEEHYTLSGTVIFPENTTPAERQSVEISAFPRSSGAGCVGQYCFVSEVNYDPETGNFSIPRLAPVTWDLHASVLSSNGGAIQASISNPGVDLSSGNHSGVMVEFSDAASIRASFIWGSNFNTCNVPKDPSGQIRVVAQEVNSGVEYPSGGPRKGDGCVEGHGFEVPPGTYKFWAEVFGKQIYLDGTVHGTTQVAEASQIEVDTFDYLTFRINLAPWLTGTGTPTSNPPVSIVAETYKASFSEYNCQANSQATSSSQPASWGTVNRYQWLRDGTEIPGATRMSYQASEADNGHTFSALVTVSLYGAEPLQVTSASTVANCPPITLGKVSVSGLPKPGNQLIAEVENSEPLGVQLSFQWQRSGADIAGATSNTYLISQADTGHYLSVVVTGILANRVAQQAVSEPIAVASLPSVIPGTVGIAGQPEVGSVLTATPSGWKPSSTQYTYQWHLDGRDIAGAVSESYSPGNGDIGHDISVTVTGKANGYRTSQVTSGSLTVTQPVLRFGPVVIQGSGATDGNASLGQTLLASLATAGPIGTAYAYQWLRNGIEIPGATNPSYTVTEGDLLASITVRVNASGSGYIPNEMTSAPIQVIELQLQLGSLTVDGAPKLGALLSAQPMGWGPGAISFTYQWLRDGQEILGANAAKYTLVHQDQDHLITVLVTASKPGYATVTRTSQPLSFTWKWPKFIRVSGIDRFATAAEISRLAYPESNDVTRVVLATGFGFADALSAAPLASKLGAPLLLTTQDQLSAAARSEIERLEPDEIVIVGGTGAISTDIAEQLARDYEVTRISGQDRFITSREVAEYGWGDEGSDQAFIATGFDFPDALSAGSAAAVHDMPVILVPGSDPKLPSSNVGQLRALGTIRVSIVGGTTAVTESIAQQLETNHIRTDRYSGANRFGTSASIATKFGTQHGDVFLASGSNYPDALAGAAVAGKQGATLILTAGECMPGEFQPVFSKLSPDRLVLLGGSSAVADVVAQPTFCN